MGVFDDVPGQGAPISQGNPALSNSNVFDDVQDKDAPPAKEAAMAPQVDPATGQPTAWQSFNDKLVQFNRGFERVAEGGLQLMSGAVSTLGSAIGVISPALGQAMQADAQAFSSNLDAVHKQKEQDYEQAWQRSHGWGSYAADIAGNLGAATVALAPTLATGTAPAFAGRLATSAAQGAALSGLQYADTPGQRLEHMGFGAAAGAIGQGIFEGIGKAAETILFPNGGTSTYVKKLFTPQKAAVEDIATRIKSQAGGNADDAIAAVKAAIKPSNDAGINTSPAQAMGGEELINLENKAFIPEKMRAEAGKIVYGSEAKVINSVYKTIDDMAQGNTKATVNQLYNKLDDIPVSKETMEKISANPIISQEMDALAKNGGKAYTGLADDSLSKMDQVKRSLDSKIKWATKDGSSMDPTQQAGLKDARTELVGMLDEDIKQQGYGSVYEEARRAAQLKTISDKWDKLLEKRGRYENKGGADQIQPPERINMALFKTPEKVNAFLKDVEATGGDVEQARAVIGLIKQHSVNPAKRILEGAPEAVKGVTPTGGISGVAKEVAKYVTTKGYKKALYNLMLSGNKWADDVTAVLAKEDTSTQKQALTDLLIQVAQTIEEVGVGANAANVGKNWAEDEAMRTSLLGTYSAPAVDAGGEGMLGYNGK